MFSAAADSAVEVDGVRVPCDGCEVSREGGCTVTIPGDETELSCERGMAKLLRFAVEQPGREAPAAAELRRYVFRDEATIEGVTAALSLLSRTSEGQEILARDLGELAAKRSEALAVYLQDVSTLPRAILEAVFRLPRRSGNEYLRGLGFAADAKADPQRLVNELSAVDPGLDAEDIREYARALKTKRPEWSERFLALAGFIAGCQSARPKELDPLCLSRPAPVELPGARRYLLRLKSHIILARLETPDLPLSLKIDWLSRLDLQHYRTPDGIAVLRRFFSELLQQPLFLQEPPSAARLLEIIRPWAAYDSELAALNALLLVRYSSGMWDLGGRREAARALLSSYEIFPDRLEARSSFVAHVAFELPREEPWYQERWNTLPRSAQDELSWAPENTTTMIVIAVIGLLAILGMLGAVFMLVRRRPRLRRERPRPVESEVSLLTLEGIGELRELLRFFDLGFPIEPEDLTRRYRQMAKLHHPDKKTGSGEDFSRLNEHYRRARALLAELSQIPTANEGSSRRKGGII